jgi:hypothetical protein
LRQAKISQILKNNFYIGVLIFIPSWFLLFCLSLYMDSKPLLFLFLFSPLAIEVILRFILFINYGINYKNSILFFSLVSDHLLGYRFRKNISVKDQSSKIFDQFLNRWYFEKSSIKNSNHINFNTDSLGFRGYGFNPTTKGSKFRIFCCGGSTTTCNNVDDEDTWPSILQNELVAKGFDVEVINAGVPGWHSYQDLLLIKNEIINYDPDLILLHQGWNEEFEFSSLNLGKWWKPRVARNEIEENFLYLPKNVIFSQKKSLLLLLSIRSISWNFIFKIKMSFTNVNRWKCLLSKKYLGAWLSNLKEIGRIAHDKKILLFTLDYPSLVNVNDSIVERNLILNNERFKSRLDENFADYQAISKQAISHFIEDISSLIPNLNAAKIFNDFYVEERILQFGDEVHMSTTGCKNFGVEIANLMSVNPDFLSKYNGESDESNVSINNFDLDEIENIAIKSKSYLHELIVKKIARLGSHKIKSIDNNIIPDERYTTF